MAKKIAETEPNPNEDVFSCIEQLICIRAQIFVGTPGSTVSNFVRHARVPLIHREPGRQTLSLSPVGFVKKSKSTKALSGQERLDHVARYWKQERQAGRAEKLPAEKRSLSSQSEAEASGHSGRSVPVVTVTMHGWRYRPTREANEAEQKHPVLHRAKRSCRMFTSLLEPVG